MEKDLIKIIFEANSEDKKLNFPKEEILDAKWIDFEDFDNIPKKDIRIGDIVTAIKDYKKRGSYPLDCIKF